MEKLVAAFKQAAFGRKSEKVDPEQFDLALEDLETAIAAIHAEDEADSPSGKSQSKPRAANRGSSPIRFTPSSAIGAEPLRASKCFPYENFAQSRVVILRLIARLKTLKR